MAGGKPVSESGIGIMMAWKVPRMRVALLLPTGHPCSPVGKPFPAGGLAVVVLLSFLDSAFLAFDTVEDSSLLGV